MMRAMLSIASCLVSGVGAAGCDDSSDGYDFCQDLVGFVESCPVSAGFESVSWTCESRGEADRCTMRCLSDVESCEALANLDAATSRCRERCNASETYDEPEDAGVEFDGGPEAEPSCAAGESSCGGAQCVPNRWVCDGDEDCGDGRDERGCPPPLRRPSPPSPPPSSACDGDELSCGDGDCVPRRWMCDGEDDCHDGRDEDGCPPPPSAECEGDELSCGDGTCVPQTWLCDGEADCDDGRDERGCNPCGTCMADQCSSEIFLCEQDPDCASLARCFHGCSGDACREGCIGRYRAGVDLLRLVGACQRDYCPVCLD